MGATESQAAAGWNRRVDAGASADRLASWCDRTERLAEGVAVVAMSLALIVFALIAIEWVRLYRSLPPGSMRLCGFVL